MFTHAVRTPAKQESFATADEAEITNIELQLSSEDLLNWEQTAQVAEKGNVNIVVKFPTSLELTDEAVGNCVKLCAALNCETLVIHEPMFRKYRKLISRLAPALKLAVENNRHTQKRFAEWAETNDSLTLDVEHFWKFTLLDAPEAQFLTELATVLREHGKKIRQVHVTGYRPGEAVHRPMYCNRETVVSILGLLAEANFDGFVVSEVSPQYFNRRDLVMDAQLVASWREHSSPVGV